MRAMLRTVALALLVVVPPIAEAQSSLYQGKTITMIVNYPAGGPTDIEGRIVAQHLPRHIPGNPTIVIKNVGGGGGVIGSNQLGEAPPSGETIGFFTIDMPGQLLGNPAIKTRYSDFVILAGVESPLVVYMRKDTPPGIKVPADLMKASDFKVLSLNLQSTNSLNQALALDILGIKYLAVPAYRGLKDVETAILQNIGQLANSSLSGWTSSVEPTMGQVVIPLWQLSPPDKDGKYPRTHALPNMQTFEEFYAQVAPGKSLVGDIRYQTMRAVSDPQLAMFRVSLMPPKSSPEAVAVLRSAFVELWKDPAFIADYSKIVRSKPILVSGGDGQKILSGVADVRREVVEFLSGYLTRMMAR